MERCTSGIHGKGAVGDEPQQERLGEFLLRENCKREGGTETVPVEEELRVVEQPLAVVVGGVDGAIKMFTLR